MPALLVDRALASRLADEEDGAGPPPAAPASAPAPPVDLDAIPTYDDAFAAVPPGLDALI